MSNTLEILALARFRSRGAELRKSRAAGAQAPQLTMPKKKAAQAAQAPQARPGAFVRVQRQDLHGQPTLARVLSSGEHGIVAMEAGGRRVKVRHEHVVEKSARPTAREQAEFHGNLAATGIPVRLEDRFLHLDPHGQAQRRPSASQLELLQELTAHGVPADMERITAGASYDDAEAILARYVTDPAGSIGKTPVKVKKNK